MNALIAAKIAERTANGLCVVTTYENGETFKYYARNAADRDARLAFATKRIGKVEVDGNVSVSVHAA